MIHVDKFEYTFICHCDPFQNETYGYEIGIFKFDDGESKYFIGLYRPEFKDYLLYRELDSVDAIGLMHRQSVSNPFVQELYEYVKALANVRTQDEYFQILDFMVDQLQYAEIVKKTPMRVTTNDSQYNLLGVIMSVNHQLLLGGCCTFEIGSTKTPFTLGKIADLELIIMFHEKLVRCGWATLERSYQAQIQ